MGRVDENKLQKQQSLMDAAFQLFTSKGIAKTSISDIVEKAGMAKGTFYLYFHDKYDLQETLIIRTSEQLFRHAMAHSGYEALSDPVEQILAIVDDVLTQMVKKPFLLRFISKNLSWGLFRQAIGKSEIDPLTILRQILGDRAEDEKKLEIAIYTVTELVGATCHSVILESNPTDMDTFLPYLHQSIRAILNSFYGA